MLGLFKKLFGSKPAAETAEVPYKVEAAPAAPQAVTSLGEPPATVVVVEGAGAVETPKPAPQKKAAPAKKAAPKKQQFEKKPAAKKPAAPRKPKSQA